ncbi:hypothetical protein BE17_40150 [Sorangium cellulosum]|uniref:Uncharacterized protein n=1 Tax=Sorangium cellulosum TaxID=56 RepID=A0A150RSN0_SORCE|nr:hypothetical protein BE17_40150 [Sorangium cellulosum]
MGILYPNLHEVEILDLEIWRPIEPDVVAQHALRESPRGRAQVLGRSACSSLLIVNICEQFVIGGRR